LAGRLTIIGGGVMGLMTAYQAAPLAESVTVFDRSRVGDPGTASLGLTRSVRNDYRDPDYARLAVEARRLWREFDTRCSSSCSCAARHSTAPRCVSGSRSSTPTAAGWTWTPGSPTWPR
jgi:glycine/D-amino acid oxidase-like deaminating enzyme